MLFQVVGGDFDFSLDMSLNVEHFTFGLGKASSFTYYIYTTFLHKKAREQSAADNVMHSFDVYTWTLLLVSLICVSLTLYIMNYIENKVLL